MISNHPETVQKDVEKVEFPTFLQQQPTIIFGRNARELLVLACGGSAALSLWQANSGLQQAWGVEGLLLSALLSALPVVLALVLAFATIGARPLEEWVFVLLAYAVAPKLYLYLPLSEARDSEQEGEQGQRNHEHESQQARVAGLGDPYQ